MHRWMDIQYTEIGCVCRYLVANWLAQQLVSKSWKAQVMSVSYVHDRGYLCDKNSELDNGCDTHTCVRPTD